MAKVVSITDKCIVFNEIVEVEGFFIGNGFRPETWLDVQVTVFRDLKYSCECKETPHFGTGWLDKKDTLNTICEECIEKAKSIWSKGKKLKKRKKKHH